MIKAAEHRSEPLLEQMDALIEEFGRSEIGYLLAFAIARKTHVVLDGPHDLEF